MPAVRILSVPEILDHQHLAERQFITRFPNIDPPQTLTGGGYRISDGDAVPPGPAPMLSEHTNVWLQKLRYSNVQIEDLRANGAI